MRSLESEFVGAGVCLAIAACAGSASSAARVWAIDDGEKIKEDATSLPFANGDANPVWSPGQPVRLFAVRNETVAIQVVVEADQAGLSDVTVELPELVERCGATLRNDPAATDPTRFVGRRIERFVEHYFDVKRPSGNESTSASLTWSEGSAPPAGRFTGRMPDALIPVEIAPSWDPYPMKIAPKRNGVVWIDITVPGTQPSGLYRGNIAVRSSDRLLADLPIELEVAPLELPDRPVDTMLFYAPVELERRMGNVDRAERNLFQLFRRHRLTAMHSAMTVEEVTRQMSSLDGSLYMHDKGYEGPGEGKGDGILSLGTYGQFGTPDSDDLANVESIVDLLEAKGVLSTTDVFVYAIDEDCSSPRGKQWVDLIAGSRNSNAKRVPVGWTCSQTPSRQPVDLPMVLASRFDPQAAERARAAGKTVWIYNGSYPHSGSFATDVEAVSPRMNGWLGSMFDVGRWFYWETTFWYDDNKGGHGAYDPFVTAETFHNAEGDYCMGEGVLVYPGRQVDNFREHSLGIDGLIASIRLKNFRRGIQDAGYRVLATNVSAAKAESVSQALIPAAFSSAKRGDPLAAEGIGKAYFDARKALWGVFAPSVSVAACPNDAGAGGGSLHPRDASAPTAPTAATAPTTPTTPTAPVAEEPSSEDFDAGGHSVPAHAIDGGSELPNAADSSVKAQPPNTTGQDTDASPSATQVGPRPPSAGRLAAVGCAMARTRSDSRERNAPLFVGGALSGLMCAGLRRWNRISRRRAGGR